MLERDDMLWFHACQALFPFLHKMGYRDMQGHMWRAFYIRHAKPVHC
jgi:hypothetical protein